MVTCERWTPDPYDPEACELCGRPEEEHARRARTLDEIRADADRILADVDGVIDRLDGIGRRLGEVER